MRIDYKAISCLRFQSISVIIAFYYKTAALCLSSAIFVCRLASKRVIHYNTYTSLCLLHISFRVTQIALCKFFVCAAMLQFAFCTWTNFYLQLCYSSLRLCFACACTVACAFALYRSCYAALCAAVKSSCMCVTVHALCSTHCKSSRTYWRAKSPRWRRPSCLISWTLLAYSTCSSYCSVFICCMLHDCKIKLMRCIAVYTDYFTDVVMIVHCNAN